MASTASQQPPHVVQAIFDSLTRCLNPIDSETPFASRCPGRHSPGESSVACHKQDNSSGSDASRRPSSDNLKAQHDADRYIHRKLEIFRTTDEDIAEMGIDPRKARKQQAKDRSKSKGHRRDRSANTLVYSSDDEIANLTNSHKRGQRGANMNDATQKESPIAGLVRLLMDPLSCLGQAQRPFGICLGTPVRAASREDVSNLSDWKLTAEEFAARQRQQDRDLGCGDAPDVDMSSASHSHCEGDEEETITSTLYFDQKYAHIPETSPPMPLYGEQRVAVSEWENDELFKMIEKWDVAGGSQGKSPHPRKGRRSSPTDHFVVKTKGKYRTTARKDRDRHYDSVPVAKSSSVSTEEGRRSAGLREPDIVHAAAAR